MTAMKSSERLRRFYFHQEMDRPAAVIRWWGFRDDPSLTDLSRLMREQADWVEPWFPDLFGRDRKTYPLKGMEDAERYLAQPLPEIGGDVSGFFRLRQEVGDRGIVLVALGCNPAGQVASFFGSEKFAILSVDARDLLHRLMQREQEIKKRIVRFLVGQGVGPYFAIDGQEMITPPLHGRDDFYDFNVRYDRPLADLIHAANGRLNVHCHGSLKAVLDGFIDLGADVLHPFEAAPMGDVTPAGVKQALRGRVALEGNIQIADFYEKTPGDIRAQVQALIRDCFDDRRGLAVTATASPFMTGRGHDCFPQYLALVEAVTAYPP